MNRVTTLGIDLAKSVFQLHGVDVEGRVVLRRQLKRSEMLAFFQRLPPCLIGIEACASAHYRARELIKFGHDVRLMLACCRFRGHPAKLAWRGPRTPWG